MTSIERTAYPRFKRVTSTREFDESFTPRRLEIAWTQGLTRSSAHLLALVVALKSFQRLGHFPAQSEVPDAVVDHVRRTLEKELTRAILDGRISEGSHIVARDLEGEGIGLEVTEPALA